MKQGPFNTPQNGGNKSCSTAKGDSSYSLIFSGDILTCSITGDKSTQTWSNVIAGVTLEQANDCVDELRDLSRNCERGLTDFTGS